MKKLTVWIFQTGEPLPIDEGSPRPMRAMNLSGALVNAGHKVVLWSAAFHHHEKRHRSIEFAKIKVNEKLEVRLIPSCGYRRNIGVGRLIDHAQLAYNLKQILRQEKDLPDVAFIGYPPIETAAVLTRWLAARGVPTLLDVKDQWPLLFLEAIPQFFRPLGSLVLWPYAHLAKRAMKDATGISAMAKGYIDWVIQFSGRMPSYWDRVFPLTSPAGQVLEAELTEAEKWWDEKGIINDGRMRFCFIGVFNSVFDFEPVRDAALMAIQENIPLEFILAGDGGFAAYLRKMMAGLPNVHFPGWIDRSQIETLAERCHAALAPYKNIQNFTLNIPNKIIDALSLGLPILCPLEGEVASLIEEYDVGLRYGPGTCRTLYDCIKILMDNPELQKRMSQNARTLYEKRFSYEKVYGELVKHLEKMAMYRHYKHE